MEITLPGSNIIFGSICVTHLNGSRHKMESERFRSAWTEKAFCMSTGRILIGDHFAEYLFEIEPVLHTEQLFTVHQTGELCSAFQSFSKNIDR
jgi:hypothetical protein